MRQSVQVVLATGIAVLVGAEAMGQWSANPSAPLAIGDRSGEQNLPKIAPTADGGCYVGWYDNSTGGYDPYLQRLDAAGHEQWAHNGILLADRSVSSTQDWDLIVDTDGNALCSFNDSATQIRVQKIDPTGAYLWGAGGVLLTGTGGFMGPPQLAELSDSTLLVAWSESNALKYQKLSSGGTPGAAFLPAVETGHTTFMSDVCAAENGSFIVLFTRSAGASYVTSNRQIFTQKYDAGFNPLWTPTAGFPGLAVFTANSIGNGYFPTIQADGAGGFVIGYYEGGGSRLAYIQHVLADGTLKFAGSGLASGVPVGRITVGGGGAYDPTTGEYFIAWPEVINGPQNQYSVSVQKWDTSGTPQWGVLGTTVIALDLANDYQNSFVQTVADRHGGCFVFGFRATATAGGSPQWTFGSQVTGGGTRRWFQYVCDITDSKVRLASALSALGQPLIVYGHGPADHDIVAQAFQQDGTIGYCGADLGKQGGVAGTDMLLDNNDFIVYIANFFNHEPTADIGAQGGAPGHDGLYDNNDFIVYIDAFFSACL